MATEVRVRRRGELENEIQLGDHRLVADEPVEAGGGGKGPDPYALLLAALGACMSMTVTLYADRKKWPLHGVTVVLRHEKVHARDCQGCAEGGEGRIDRIEKELHFEGPLDESQIERLRDIAGRCPVHRTLTGRVDIVEVS